LVVAPCGNATPFDAVSACAGLLRARLSIRALAREVGVTDGHLSRVMRRVNYKTAGPELARGWRLRSACPPITSPSTGASMIAKLLLGETRRINPWLSLLAETRQDSQCPRCGPPRVSHPTAGTLWAPLATPEPSPVRHGIKRSPAPLQLHDLRVGEALVEGAPVGSVVERDEDPEP
jgi:hypothetical protein